MNVDLSGIDVQTIGWILTLVGVGGLVLSLTMWNRRRVTVREEAVVRDQPVVRDTPVVREERVIREDPPATDIRAIGTLVSASTPAATTSGSASQALRT